VTRSFEPLHERSEHEHMRRIRQVNPHSHWASIWRPRSGWPSCAAGGRRQAAGRIVPPFARFARRNRVSGSVLRAARKEAGLARPFTAREVSQSHQRVALYPAPTARIALLRSLAPGRLSAARVPLPG
jgi:hypothetical protein